jgi:hypothetical protein
LRREPKKRNRVSSRLPHHHHFTIPPTTTRTLYLPPNMAERSIKSLFSSAERQRKDIEASWDSNTATYQQNLAAAISTYEDCLKLADRLSLFSPNETLEDLTSGDLQYVSIALFQHRANFPEVPAHQLPPRRPHPPPLLQRPQIHPSKSPRSIRALHKPTRPLRDPLHCRQEAVQRLHRIPHHLLYNLKYGPQCAARGEDCKFQARKGVEEEAGGMSILLRRGLGALLMGDSSWHRIQRTCKMTMMLFASYSLPILLSAHTIPSNPSNL